MGEADRSTTRPGSADALSSNASLWTMFGLLAGGALLIFLAGFLRFEPNSFVMYFAGTALLLDIVLFCVATMAVLSEYLATKNNQFRIITVMAMMAIIGAFISVTRFAGVFWTFLLTGLVVAIALPAIFVRYGAPTKSVAQAVIRGVLVTMLFAYATCTVLLAWIGVSDNMLGSIGPARDIDSLILCAIGGIIFMLIGGLFGFPPIALGVIAIVSSVYGFNLRQEDEDEAEIAARRAQLEHEYRQMNKGLVNRSVDEQ